MVESKIYTSNFKTKSFRFETETQIPFEKNSLDMRLGLRLPITAFLFVNSVTVLSEKDFLLDFE